jgi:hypothetical protein
MKKETVVVVSVLILVLLIGASVPVMADAARKVTGMVHFDAFGKRIWMRFNVHETDPDTHRAEGRVAWKMYDEELGWRYLVTRVSCVTYGEDLGQDPQTAVISGQIVQKQGWGPGVVGEWFRFWVRDGGLPSSSVDQWASQTHGVFPDEFWPEDDPPGCAYFVPGESPNTPPQPFDVVGGNLTIHH